MKKFIGLVLILVGCSFLVMTITSMSTSSKTSNEGKQFISKVDAIETIDLSSTSIDWDIQSHSGHEIIVELLHDRKQVEIHSSQQGTSLKIEIKEEGINWFPFNFKGKSKARVQVPSDFQRALKIQTVSGDVILDDLWNLSSWRVRTVSGDVMANELSVTDTDLHTTSGDILVRKLESEKVKVNNVSGDILLEKVAGEVTANAVSGDIRIGLIENQPTRAKTVSGDVSLELYSKDANLTMKTVSGNIFVEPGFTGRIGNKDAEITVHTTSGDILITER